METVEPIAWPVIIGLFITVAFAVIGWFLYRLNANVSTMVSTLKTDMQNMATRLDGDIKSIRESAVFKDVFEQHEKLEDIRYKSTERMHSVLAEQLKSSATANQQEHNRICGKLDGLVTAIYEVAEKHKS